MHLTELTIAYGLTETSPGITQTPRDASLDERTQTVGKVMPEIEVRIVDPATGEDVPTGRAGRVVGARLRRDEGLLQHARADGRRADGRRLAALRRSGRDRWRGNVRITGRIKDLIIRGGENIAPKEVEDVLRLHPAIADVSVYAVKSEFFGEEVAAAIRPHPGATIDAAEVMRFCQDRLARFKVPRHIRIVDGFPMTASGKIQKFKLRELHEAELTAVSRSSSA